MMGGANNKKQQSLVTQTRTDFLIQFVWQPPTVEKPAKPIEEIRKALAEAENDPKNKQGFAAYDPTKIDDQLEAESVKGSQAKVLEATKAGSQTGGIGAGPAAGPSPAPAAPPAAGPAPGTLVPGGSPTAPPR